MSNYEQNRDAINKARRLIKANQYILDSDWSDAQPSTEDQNKYLNDHDWEEYREWFLAVDSDASEGTKQRCNFPFGDFRRVHRSGLVAAKQRAAQNGHDRIEAAVDQLLELLDEVSADR